MSFSLYKQNDGTIVNLLYLNFCRDKTFVVAHPFSIELLDETGKPYDEVSFDHRIMAIGHIKPPGLDQEWLIVLDQTGQLMVLGWDGRFVVVQQFKIASAASSVEVCPIIDVDQSNRYVLVYSTEGYMTILELSPDKSDVYVNALHNDAPSQVQKRPDAAKLRHNRVFEKPKVIYIGHGIVHSALFLQSKLIKPDQEGVTFAVISRDSNLKYSASYYSISKEVELSKRFPQMSSPPSLALPLPMGALLVVCEDVQYLYPSPGVRSLSSEIVKTTRQYASKELVSENDGRLSKFVSWCFDGSVFWLCSEFGDVFRLQVELKSESLQIAEQQLSMSIAERRAAGPVPPIELGIVEWTISRVLNEDVFHCLVFADSKIVGCNHFGQICIFNDHFKKPSQLRNPTNLPVTGLAGEYVSHGTHNYSTVDLNGTIHVDGLVKSIVETKKQVVLVVEQREINLEREEIKQTDRLEVYEGTTKVGEHRLDSGISVRKVLPVSSLECRFDERFKVSNEQRFLLGNRLKESVVVVVNDEEDQTGLLLMRFENNEWYNEGSAVISGVFDDIIQIEDYELLLIGSHTVAWISVYAATEFWFRLEESDFKSPIAYFSAWSKLRDGNLIVADGFSGLYLMDVDRSRRKLECQWILRNVMVSAFAIFSDKLVVGDVIGNVFVASFGESPELVQQTYLGSGSVICMEATEEGIVIGTSEGQITMKLDSEHLSTRKLPNRAVVLVSSCPEIALNPNCKLAIVN